MEHIDKKIADFLKASNEIEQHLHSNGSLTPLQRQTIDTTILGLHTFMDSWVKTNHPEKSSFLKQLKRRGAEGS
jgi:hypothetical protein